MPAYIDEYDRLLKDNEILLARTKGVGILTSEMAINSSAAGPVLRGSGVKWDIRKVDPYSVYEDSSSIFLPVKAGDCYDRYRVRIEEMRQSVRIMKQAVRTDADGPGTWQKTAAIYSSAGRGSLRPCRRRRKASWVFIWFPMVR